jgi:hypothetical protein
MKAIDPGLVARLAETWGTPYYLYDAAIIRERVASLSAFDVIRYARASMRAGSRRASSTPRTWSTRPRSTGSSSWTSR